MSALAGAGVVVAAAASAATMLLAPSRVRSAAMLAALVLFPVLIAGERWHSAAIADLRGSLARLALLALIAAAIVVLLAVLLSKRPRLLPLAIIAALPFRIPLHAGGDQANLLIPLYLVIAGAVLATTLRDWGRATAGEGSGEPSDRAAEPAATASIWLTRVLAAAVLLYALQTLYSDDFSKGLQNVCFFAVPFSLAFSLLLGVRWDRRLLRSALTVVTVEALVFVAVGLIEYAARDLLWNGAVIRSNDFHVYFRVNSLFWDPNLFGRYLALAIVALAAALLFTRNRRDALISAGAIAALWLGLVTTFSQSSFAALVGGLAVLAALRWSLRWTALACVAGVLAAIVFLAAAGGSLKLDLSSGHTVNKDTSGRANLISGGADLFADRPLLGYGTGSFSTAFRHRAGGRAPVSESHTEPITVAAEQGTVGLIVYLALLATALWTMIAGLGSLMPGLRRAPPAGAPAAQAVPRPWSGAYLIARAAVLAMFGALIVHTLAYAGFVEDPTTWVLLAVAASLAIRPSA